MHASSTAAAAAYPYAQAPAGSPLPDAQATAIRVAYLAKEGGYGTLAKRFGVTKHDVARCIRKGGIIAEVANAVAVDIPGVEQHARDRALERFGLSPTKAH